MFLQIFTFIINIFLINGVFLISFLLRYGFDVPEKNFEPYRQIFPALTFCYMLAFAVCRVFRSRFRAYWQIFARIFLGMFFGTLTAFVFLYVFRIKWATFPSSVFLINLVVGVPIMTIANSLIYRAFKRIVKTVILVNDKEKNTNLIEIEDTARTKHIVVNSIYKILEHKDIDEIMLCEHIDDDNQLNLLIYLLLKLRVKVFFEPSIYADLLSGNLQNGNSLKYLATFLGQKNDAEEFFIRVLDFALALLMLILGLPLMIIIAISIKLTSRGPILFKQERIGKDGQEFNLFKFRTMVDNAEKNTGPVLASANDPRVTKLGKFLRATRIDELPQLYNVITGSMSLVGPRPEREHFVKIHKALRGLRLAVKPGLTGLAQIRNAYDLHPRHKIKYDYLYIQKRSLLLNIYIILKTIPVMLSKKGQ